MRKNVKVRRFVDGRLARFYAVTLTSVYEAVIYGAKVAPWLEKLALKTESKFKLGHKIGDGTMLSIGKQLIMFVPEGSGVISPTSTIERDIVGVNTHYWGSQTSYVVALFMNKGEAMKCHKASNQGLVDSRWKSQTIAVLRAIGKKHPNCSISTERNDSWLMPPDEWQK